MSIRSFAVVVLAFLVPPGAGADGTPLQELVGWDRVHVRAGQTVTVTIDAPRAAFTLVDARGVRAPRAGAWTLRLGVQATKGRGMGFEEARVDVE